MQFYKHATPLGIGNTPLLPYEEDFDADIFFKQESMNVTGSIKDRPALAMILQAESDGILKAGDTIVEATSGNMGISLAHIGKQRGYKVVLTMPDNMSIERKALLQGLGAQLVLTEGALGMQGAIDTAKMLAQNDGHVWLKQFENKANVVAHYLSTGKEIAGQIDRVDIFVAGVGTGGTIVGVAKRLKEVFPQCKIVGVEPASSPAISRGERGAHKIQGIGAGFTPTIYDKKVVDEIQLVTDEQAMDKFLQLNKKLGYCCGISAGANVVVCERLAQMPEHKGKKIVTIFPDGDDRYESLLKVSN